MTELREGSAVLLVDAAGRVLLQQRDDDIPPAGVGRWAIPGGGREGDEDPLTTALREFEEETTVRLSRARHFATYRPSTAAWMRRFIMHLFVAEDDVERGAIEVLEGMDFQYWPPEEALELPANPAMRHILTEVLESPLYQAARARQATGERWACVLEIDRWGSVLVVRPGDVGRPGDWSLPGGLTASGESPDRAALRHFEETVGRGLETLRLFRGYSRASGLPLGPAAMTHVYYFDADLAVEELDLRDGMEARYVGPGELEAAPLAAYARAILVAFFASPAYKAMFH